MAKTEKTSTDPLDDKILRLLLDNSRQSYREIARKLSISVATVMKRVQLLEKSKMIKGYTALLDYEKLGYDVGVLIEVRISKGKLLEMERRIASHPNVAAVYDHTGNFDCLILAKFKTRKQMDKFLKHIQTWDFVQRTETMLILNTLKEAPIKI
ncbi:Lrp/AsnC family transcriptional regulator [Candidatus Woesearchaeota archaeon]|nr:Lrp/AsnC family transcriptional regulator [Candidatus Woesearchaeota archaeon]